MRLVPVVCLAALGLPAVASADERDKKKAAERDDDDRVDDDPIRWGLGVQARRSRVSVRLQKVFLDGTPGPATQDGGGVTFVRRTRALDIVLGFGGDQINPVDGYYLSTGGDPMESGDADLVEFDAKLKWYTFDISFIGHAKAHKVLAFRFGAGVGLGVIRGHGYRTSAICTSNDLQNDCVTDPMGERQNERIDVPVFPVLNVLLGVELRPARWLAIDLDAGLHTAPYLGLGVTIFPWKT